VLLQAFLILLASTMAGAAAAEKAAKRRLSMSGRSDEVFEEKIDAVDYQIQQRSMEKMLGAHSQMIQGLEKKEKNVVYVTPYGYSDRSIFEWEYKVLGDTPHFQEAIQSGLITNIDDAQVNKVVITVFQTSKMRGFISSLHNACAAEGLSLNVAGGQAVGVKNVKRVPRLMFETIAHEFDKHGMEYELLKSRLPNSFGNPNFEHAYEVMGQKYVVMKGELTSINMESELKHMLIQVPTQIVVEGMEQEPWDLQELFEKSKEVIDKVEGYPWILCIEQCSEPVEPLQTDPRAAKLMGDPSVGAASASTEDQPMPAGKGNAQKGGKGKGKGKGGKKGFGGGHSSGFGNRNGKKGCKGPMAGKSSKKSGKYAYNWWDH